MTTPTDIEIAVEQVLRILKKPVVLDHRDLEAAIDMQNDMIANAIERLERGLN